MRGQRNDDRLVVVAVFFAVVAAEKPGGAASNKDHDRRSANRQDLSQKAIYPVAPLDSNYGTASDKYV